MIKRAWHFVLIAFLFSASSAAPLTEDTVRVTGTRLHGNAARPLTVITSEELHTAPVTTLSEALALAGGVDVQQRGLPGAQADVTMRGGMFEQVLVLVDGVRMNSVQTGHLHADLPVAMDMIDRIEVMPGQASSVYGADAANGVINVITKKNADGFSASLGYGEYGTLDAGLLLGVESAGMHHTVCVRRAQSDGYRYDTDYANTFVNLKSRKEYGAGTFEAALQYGDRGFGAFDFYTPGSGYPSKEWTRTGGITVKNRHVAGLTTFESFLAVRQQYDRFVLFVDDPLVYQNEHTVRYLEAETFAARPVGDRFKLSAGMNVGIDHLASTQFGDRHGQRQALFSEMRYAFTPYASVTAGIRIDRHDGTVSAAPSLLFSGRASDRLSWSAHAGMATRTPSYTERFYMDGSKNYGNADLADERTMGMEAGAKYVLGDGVDVRLTAHATRYDDYIDWRGTSAAGPWYASNMGRMLVYGMEPGLSIRNRYVRAALRASVLRRELSETYISKYAFRYPETAVTFTAGVPLAADRAELGIVASYRQRSTEEGYLRADLRLRTVLAYGVACRFDVKNVFDVDYEDIPGVPQPGRMVYCGLEYNR